MKKALPLVSLGALYALFLSLAFAAGYYTRAITPETRSAARPLPLPGLSAPSYALLDEARRVLEAHSINPLPDDKTLEYGAIRGLVGALGDQYTVFVEPQAHELETQSLQGEYGGIGVGISQNQTGEIVLSPFPDSPALRAGLVEGDILLAVDSALTAAPTTIDEVTALIRGLVGTPVEIRVRHPDGEEFTATIIRQNIPLPTTTWKIIDGQPSIGLIAVNLFSDKTPGEVRRAIADLQVQGTTRYILDLRNNGGGILTSAVEVASQFLEGGVIMYETQRNAPEKVYTASESSGALLAAAPLAVLVNHNTASSAEIVAGALLDRGRAPLIGQTTYGKGSVQLVFDLSDGSSLHVTSYLWYTPGRRALDKVGLAPTIAVEPAPDGSDAELTRAVQYLVSGQ